MVQNLDNQESTIDHLEKIGGKEVVRKTDNTTYEPPIKTEVVTSKPLINKALDHLTIKTTYPEGYKKQIVLEGEE